MLYSHPNQISQKVHFALHPIVLLGIIAIGIFGFPLTSVSGESLDKVDTPSTVGILESSAATPNLQRLKMPSQFDRSTIRHLLDTIEQGRNASILKFGYFFRHGTTSLAIEDGFVLLKSAIAKEPPGSARWFILQNVRAWAAFRNHELPLDEGFDAYDAIFQYAGEAKKVGALYTLNSSFSDYVFTVAGHFKTLALLQDDRTKATLFKAWKAYVTALSKGQVAGRSPLWSAAIAEAKLTEEFEPELERVLRDTTVPKNFDLLMAAAEILSDSNPLRSIELLREAKVVLPKGKKLETKRFYTIMVNLLLRQGTMYLPEAITLQQEYIGLTDRGRAKLVVLYANREDEEAIMDVIAGLMGQDDKAQEINETVTTVLNLKLSGKIMNPKTIEQSVSLMVKYLSAPSERQLKQELQAHINLARLYLSQGKSSEARQTLVEEQTKLSTSNPQGLQEYLALIHLIEQLNKESPPRAYGVF